RHTSSDRDWSSDVCSSDLADLERADSGGVDPDPRITLDDLREDVVAVWAAENDAGATVDVNGADRSGCATAGTGPNRGCHLDCEIGRASCRERAGVEVGAG